MAESKSPQPRETIQRAKRRLSRELFKHPDLVSGVGIEQQEDGDMYIKVYVKEDSPEVHSVVPETVDGYAVKVESIGSVRPREEETR